eukprot:29644-Pelagococcus_subviridis.AAC.6
MSVRFRCLTTRQRRLPEHLTPVFRVQRARPRRRDGVDADAPFAHALGAVGDLSLALRELMRVVLHVVAEPEQKVKLRVVLLPFLRHRLERGPVLRDEPRRRVDKLLPRVVRGRRRRRRPRGERRLGLARSQPLTRHRRRRAPGREPVERLERPRHGRGRVPLRGRERVRREREPAHENRRARHDAVAVAVAVAIAISISVASPLRSVVPSPIRRPEQQPPRLAPPPLPRWRSPEQPQGRAAGSKPAVSARAVREPRALVVVAVLVGDDFVRVSDDVAADRLTPVHVLVRVVAFEHADAERLAARGLDVAETARVSRRVFPANLRDFAKLLRALERVVTDAVDVQLRVEDVGGRVVRERSWERAPLPPPPRPRRIASVVVVVGVAVVVGR